MALCDLAESFGQPHAHTGRGIRKLAGKLFACRGKRDLRFVFQDRGGDFSVSFSATLMRSEPFCAAAVTVERVGPSEILESWKAFALRR